jgi:hypothetical protein
LSWTPKLSDHFRLMTLTKDGTIWFIEAGNKIGRLVP